MKDKDMLKIYDENDLVSVVVPVYNVAEYLRECVDSIIGQSYSNLEIILVDDGSTDCSGDICDDYEKKDKRIKVIHKDNGGLSSARNAGMDIMTGKFCTFIDSDDVVSVSFIEKMMKKMQENNADIVACSYTRDINDLESKQEGTVEIADAHKALMYIFSEKTMSTSAWGKLYKSTPWKGIRFPEGYIYEDYATIYKVILLANMIVISSDPHYFYRPNPESITGTSFYPKRLQYFEITNSIIPVIEDTYPDLLAIIDNRTTRYAISYFKQMAIANYKDEEALNDMRKMICKGIKNYLKTSYSPLSKAYGILIICSPKLAFKLFSK